MIVYNEKGELERTEDYGEKGKPLFFKDTHGAGEIVCNECGFTQNIYCLLHDGPHNLSVTT